MEGILGAQVAQGHIFYTTLLRGLNPDCISSNLVMQQTQLAMFASCKPGKHYVLVTALATLECCLGQLHLRVVRFERSGRYLLPFTVRHLGEFTGG